MPCCVNFWTWRLLPDGFVTSCEDRNVGMVGVSAAIDLFQKRWLYVILC